MFLEDKSKSAGVETKADPFSLEALIAWLEKQPSATEYDYTDYQTCMLGQYCTSSGGQIDTFGPNLYRIEGAAIPIVGSRFAIDIARPRPHTFGAALSRALALQEAK